MLRKANKVVGCVWGIGERKWEDDLRRGMVIFENMIESILYGTEIWDLGMEGTRRGKESGRKIFQRGARSGQKNIRLHSEGRVRGIG
jgi:hypothetical protein